MMSDSKTNFQPQKLYAFALLIIGTLLTGCLSQGAANGSQVSARVFSGLFSPDNNEFVDCVSQEIVAVLDSTQQLSNEIKKLKATNGYVELTGFLVAADSLDMGGIHDSVLIVSNVTTVKPTDLQSPCITPQNSELLTVKEFGCGQLQFSNPNFFGKSEEELAQLLPGFKLQAGNNGGEEIIYEYRRGFGTVTFNADSLNNVLDAMFEHPLSSDQFQTKIGMTLDNAKALRSALKSTQLPDDDQMYFSTTGSHIYYLTDAPDPKNVNWATAKIVAIVWKKRSCP